MFSQALRRHEQLDRLLLSAADEGQVIGSRDFVTKPGSVPLDGDEQIEFVLQVARDELLRRSYAL